MTYPLAHRASTFDHQVLSTLSCNYGATQPSSTPSAMHGSSARSSASVRLPTQPNTLTILKWGPGQGKSTRTRESIKAALNAGQLQRVIWAVQGTLDDASLGQEAVLAFSNLDVRATLIKGKEHLTSSEYQLQWRWGGQPEVKIVPFAYLPILYGQDSSFQDPMADLLVIDEDPVSQLIQDSKFSQAELFQWGREGCRVADHLAQLLSDRADHPTPDGMTCWKPNRFSSVVRYHHTGESFLRMINRGFRDDDWHAFQHCLEAAEIYHAAALVRALRHDIEHAELGSHRFGMTWDVSEGKGKPEPVFVYSVLPALRALPPTLVLDAYASKPLYAAAFSAVKTIRIQSGKATPPLEIERWPDLKLDVTNLRARRGVASTVQKLEELLLLHRQSPLSLLGSKELVEVESVLQEHLRKAARGLGLSEDQLPWTLYYHAGRGVNTHAGRSLVSLMPPVLPRMHERHTMAALFPTDGRARKRAHRYLLQSEHLQMLHRVRQAFTEESQTPLRIITAYDPELPRSTCITKDYAPQLRYVKNSRHPRWRDAMAVVVAEMLNLFGGVPRSMLGVIGLLKVRFGGSGEALHTQALHAALERAGVQPETELGHWHHVGTLKRFADVGMYSRNNSVKESPVNALMGELGLVASQEPLFVMYRGRRCFTTVWAPEGTDHQQVLTRIYGAAVGSA